MTTKKVNESNTKKEILDAFQASMQRIQELEGQKLDPAKEQTAKAQTATLTQAAKTASTSIEDQIASLQKNVAGILGNLSNSFSEEIKNFNTLQEAIKLKEQELKELIDIEKEAFTLAALVNTRKELAAKFDAEQAEKQAAAYTNLADLNDQMAKLRIDTQAEIKQLKADAEQTRKREQAEYTYDFNRKKQQDQDALTDELNLQRKSANESIATQNSQLAEKEKALNERTSVLETREEKMDELEAKIAAFPEREAQIRAEVEDRTRKDEARTAAIKDNYVKKQAESDKALAETEIKMLKESLADEKVKTAELAKKLDEAYGKIQSMALASVNGSQEAKAFEKMAGMMNEKK
ncbi:MAG: hypothetical protein K0R18_5 [Bacillales bacterium]|jgi:hypothetical protein|nr:hypothetical protein [Bacillales bacterium]